MLRYREDKGHLRHEEDGPRYAYLPTSPKDQVRGSALRHVVRTFFDGSVSTAVAALLEASSLDREEYERLLRLLREPAKEASRERPDRLRR